MAVTTDNIKLGVCDATFGALDLGATKGGVEVEIKTETYEVKVDQFGETVVKELVTGTVVTVKVPMAETDLERIKALMPQSAAILDAATSTTTIGVEIRSGVNVDLLDHADVLKLHPTGLAAGVTDQDFTVFKAAPSPNFSFRYDTGAERVYEVTFKGYPDMSADGKIAAFGSPTSV